MITDKIMSFISDLKNNKRFTRSLLISYAVCLMAHAFAYFNATFCTDRFRWFYGVDLHNIDGASTGKWLGSYTAILTWRSYLPWLSGVLFMTFLGISVYIVCEILDIRSIYGIVLVAGLYATDSSIIMAHLYNPANYSYPLLFASLSMLLWHRENIKMSLRVAGGSIFIAFSLATYGSYASVAPTVVILACMLMLIDGIPVKNVLKRGTEYIITFVLGLGIYYIVQRILLVVLDVEMIDYLGEDKLVNGVSFSEILYFIEIAYKNAIKKYLGIIYTYKPVPQWMAIALVIVAAIILTVLLYRNDRMKKQKGSYILFGILLLVFPLSAGLIYVMAFGQAHLLMRFTFVIFYVGIVKLTELNIEKNRQKKNPVKLICQIVTFLSIFMLSFMVYKGILVSNICYSRLTNLYEVSNGIAMRVLDRIEDCEGFEGDESICFVGDVTESEYFTKSRYDDSNALDIVDGLLAVSKDKTNTFLYRTHLIMLMQENANVNLDIDYYDPDSDVYSDSDVSIIDSMPVFPADGSVRKIGDTVVVKFVDNE